MKLKVKLKLKKKAPAAKPATKPAAKPAAAATRDPIIGSVTFDDLVEGARRRAKHTALLDALRAQDQHYRDTHPGIVKLDYIHNMRAMPNSGLMFL